MSSFRKFVSHFSHFFTGMGLAQLLGFISFPILTRILTKEQYGIMSLVSTTMLLSVALSKAGLSDGIIRFYKEYSDTAEKRDIFSSTVIMRGLLFSVSACFLYMSALLVLNHYTTINHGYLVCFLIMTVYLFVRPLNIIVANFLRVNGKTVYLNGANLVTACISVGLSLVLLLYVFRELYGYFIGSVIAELILSGIFFSYFFKHYKVAPARISGNLALQLIKFGLPLLFSECAFLALSYVDRYLILAYYDEAVLGLYSVGYTLAMYIANILMLSISYAIIPIYIDIYSTEGKEKTEAFLTKCLHYLLIVLIPICFGYAAIARDVFVTLASNKYAAAALFSPLILVGTLIFALNSIFNSGLYLAKRSTTILGIMVLAVVVKVVMNIILLPSYGVMGAAVATLVPCAMVTVLSAFLSYKYIKVKIDIKETGYYLVLSLGMFFIVQQIEVPRAWVNLLAKMTAGVFIIAIGTLLREKEIVALLKVRLWPVKA